MKQEISPETWDRSLRRRAKLFKGVPGDVLVAWGRPGECWWRWADVDDLDWWGPFHRVFDALLDAAWAAGMSDEEADFCETLR